MISTMQIIFQTCSEFDRESFCKNRFLKKSFLKVLINQIFVIFCSFLVSKWDQKLAKNHKFWSDKDFQKWFFQKSVFSENFSIKFWTSLKNELHGKNQFPGLENNFSWFSVDFRPKIRSIGDFLVDFYLMKQICGHEIKKSTQENHFIFFSELNEVLFCGTQQTAHELLT